MAVKMILRRMSGDGRIPKEEFLLSAEQADMAIQRLMDMRESVDERVQNVEVLLGRPVFVRFRDVLQVDHFYRVDELRHVQFIPGAPEPEIAG